MAPIIRGIKRHHYILAASVLSLLFVLQNTQLLGLSGIFNYNLLYFLKAALWITLGLMIWKFPTVLPSGLIRLRGTVILLALIFSLFHADNAVGGVRLRAGWSSDAEAAYVDLNGIVYYFRNHMPWEYYSRI